MNKQAALVLAIGAFLAGLLLTQLDRNSARAQQSVVVPATTSSITLNGGPATIAKIISGITGQRIYITQVSIVPVATAVVTLSQGTGTNCGTGTAAITSAMTFAAGQTFIAGTGNGAVFALNSGNDLCITTATAAAPGSLAFSQF